MSELFLLLELVKEVLEKIPNYGQRKKNEFYKMKRDYENEVLKNVLERDDNKITSLRNKLKDFSAIFIAEIKGTLPYPKDNE